mmetsp:Transcript_60923/g.193255  ORF Transcript_60923/g.193255 Transcript_60923/m.193255 type:complete len:279 (-) Transcript_60923:440-1276(-)
MVPLRAGGRSVLPAQLRRGGLCHMHPRGQAHGRREQRAGEHVGPRWQRDVGSGRHGGPGRPGGGDAVELERRRGRPRNPGGDDLVPQHRGGVHDPGRRGARRARGAGVRGEAAPARLHRERGRDGAGVGRRRLPKAAALRGPRKQRLRGRHEPSGAAVCCGLHGRQGAHLRPGLCDRGADVPAPRRRRCRRCLLPGWVAAALRQQRRGPGDHGRGERGPRGGAARPHQAPGEPLVHRGVRPPEGRLRRRLGGQAGGLRGSLAGARGVRHEGDPAVPRL